ERIMQLNYHPLVPSCMALLLAACLVTPGAVAAAENVPFLNGGVGSDQQQEMLAVRKDYNLLLTFATRGSGAFVADVHLTVTDHAGKPVLQVNGAGPLLYARLAPGSYKVEATARGLTQAQAATIPKQGPRELYFYWAPEAEATQ
ncbi:MAG TPA: hypothetical protein VFT05_09730, partial [Burkholderiaceae bacterium]|nr:hypothetical protein [Burkholderiaceae bacterium]